MQVIFVINRSIYFILHIFRETHLKYEYKKKKKQIFLFSSRITYIKLTLLIQYSIFLIHKISILILYMRSISITFLFILKRSFETKEQKIRHTVFYLHIILPLPLIAIKPFIRRAKNLPDETLDFIPLSKKIHSGMVW